MSVAIISETTEAALPLTLTVDKEDVGGLTGLSPTVAVRDGATTDSYLDWADDTFKTSGWVTRYQALSEVGGGHYQAILDVDALGLSAGDMLIAEYMVDEAAAKGAAHDVVVIVAADSDLITEVWDHDITGREATPNSAARVVDLQNKLVRGRLRTNPTADQLELYDPVDDAILLTWSLTDFAGGSIANVVGAPFDRRKAVES